MSQLAIKYVCSGSEPLKLQERNTRRGILALKMSITVSQIVFQRYHFCMLTKATWRYHDFSIMKWKSQHESDDVYSFFSKFWSCSLCNSWLRSTVAFSSIYKCHVWAQPLILHQDFSGRSVSVKRQLCRTSPRYDPHISSFHYLCRNIDKGNF